MTQTARQYRARLDQPIRHRGRDFTLRSDDGCFWDIYLAGTLVFPDATNKANAIAIVCDLTETEIAELQTEGLLRETRKQPAPLIFTQSVNDVLPVESRQARNSSRTVRFSHLYPHP